MAAMDSCFVSLKSDTQLMKGNWGGFDRCENRFFGEKVRGGFSENVWIRSLKSEKKALKLTPNVTYAVATPNVSKQPMVSSLHLWMAKWPCLIYIFGSFDENPIMIFLHFSFL